jgi:hypothetical protein
VLSRVKETGAKRSAIEKLAADILSGSREGEHETMESWRNPAKDLDRLASRDYVRALRRQLSLQNVRSVISNAARVWPNLNAVQLHVLTQGQFARTARRMTADLNVHLQASPYAGPEGLALRGFYVEKTKRVLKRPLIYVNTAHHPGAVSSTFCHEIGHHLTSQLFGSPQEGVHFFFDAAYAEHLDDPIELAADVLVSLAGYPAAVAREIFARPWNWGLVAKAGRLSEEEFFTVRKHAEGRFDLDFGAPLPAKQRLNYLAGMIHYAKLRWALLAEYDL